MHGYGDSGLEVYVPREPEARYDREHFAPESVHHSQHWPLEVVPPSAPEPAHDPTACPPELAYDHFDENSSVDAPTKGSATVREGLEKLGSKSEFENDGLPPKPVERRRLWPWIALAAVVVALAAVGLGVGLTLGRKLSTSASSPGRAPGSPASTSNSSSSALPYISPTSSDKPSILHNSSVAAVSCDDGDRWVFLQDINGYIRGAHYTMSSGRWTVSSDAYSFATAALGTPIGATCGNQSSLGYPPGPATVIWLVYLNESSALQQSIYDGSTWSNVPILPALQTPNNNTKLSVTSGILPQFTDSQDNGTSSSTTVFATNWFSAALYKSDDSLVMVSLLGASDSSQTNSTNNFAHFGGVGTQPLSDEGFSCIHDGLLPPDGSVLYQQCFFGHSTASPPDSTIWQYNRSALDANYTIDPMLSQSSSLQKIQEGSTSTDLTTFLLPNNQLALVSLLANNSIALYTGKVAAPLSKGPFVWPEVIPTAHIAATSLTSHSSLIYVYYQANASALGEAVFDTSSEMWAEPVYIGIT